MQEKKRKPHIKSNRNTDRLKFLNFRPAKRDAAERKGKNPYECLEKMGATDGLRAVITDRAQRHTGLRRQKGEFGAPRKERKREETDQRQEKGGINSIISQPKRKTRGNNTGPKTKGRILKGEKRKCGGTDREESRGGKRVSSIFCNSRTQKGRRENGNWEGFRLKKGKTVSWKGRPLNFKWLTLFDFCLRPALDT